MKIEKICECKSSLKIKNLASLCSCCWICDLCGAKGCSNKKEHLKMTNVLNKPKECNTINEKINNNGNIYLTD